MEGALFRTVKIPKSGEWVNLRVGVEAAGLLSSNLERGNIIDAPNPGKRSRKYRAQETKESRKGKNLMDKNLMEELDGGSLCACAVWCGKGSQARRLSRGQTGDLCWDPVYLAPCF